MPQAAAACTAVLLFMQLSLGLLLPVLLAAYTWQPAAATDGDTGILAMPRVAHLQVNRECVGGQVPSEHASGRLALELACAPSTRPTPSAHQHPRTPHSPLPQHLAAPHIAFLRTLRNSIASWLSKGTMGADAAVHALLGSSTGLSSRAAAAYWVVSLCWVFCKRLAGIYAVC